MTQRISGPGIGLPYPQNLYPSQVGGNAPDTPSNKISLVPGDTLPVPAGDWFINTGQYLVLQFLDPISNAWSMGPNAAWIGGHQFVTSDGFNVRVANLTGCICSAVVESYGTAGTYLQATTTIVASEGGSTWLPIVGGQLTPTVISAGAGYGVAPEIFIPPPPPASNNANGVGGLAAAAWATISSGTLALATGVSMINPGAGYPSPVTVVLVPSPTDPNLATGITNATVIFSLTGSGSLTGAICTNNGGPVANPNAVTLTVAGAGTGASLSAQVLQTIQTVSVTTVGTGYGTVSALLTTVGGVPSTGSISNNPDGAGIAWRPRPAQVGLSVAGTGVNGTLSLQKGTIYDGGLFLTNAAPNIVLALTPAIGATTSAIFATVASISVTMGNRKDIATLQPAP